MPQGTWSLHDSPIFWTNAAAPSPPGKVAGVYTSYNYLWVDAQPDGGGVMPEVAAAIARGDRRHMSQE